jgi:hypothetical protein
LPPILDRFISTRFQTSPNSDTVLDLLTEWLANKIDSAPITERARSPYNMPSVDSFLRHAAPRRTPCSDFKDGLGARIFFVFPLFFRKIISNMSLNERIQKIDSDLDATVIDVKL